jgi:hypothetical protein
MSYILIDIAMQPILRILKRGDTQAIDFIVILFADFPCNGGIGSPSANL